MGLCAELFAYLVCVSVSAWYANVTVSDEV